MKALVTGVAGFIGSHLAERLLRDGHEVIGVDCFTDYYGRDLKEANLADVRATGGQAFSFVEADLNSVDLTELLQPVTHVFHQAGQPGVRLSWGTDFAAYIDANIAATQRLLEAARTAPALERVVYASSSSVYGDAERYPTTELDRPMPRSPYGVTKLAAEHLCVLYAKNFGVPTTSLRYFTVYGPRQRPDMAFTRFLKAALRGDTIGVYGDGEQVRDFTYVADIVEANVRAAMTDTPAGAVYNVAGGSSVTVNEVLAIIEKLTERPLDVHRSAAVDGDVRITGGSTGEFTAATGWTSTVTVEEGLERHLAWAEETLADVPSRRADAT